MLAGVAALAGCASSPLRKAAFTGEYSKVQELADGRGALDEAGFCCDTGALCAELFSTPLGCAAYGGHVEIMKALIAKGAKVDVECDDASYASPLACAVWGNHREAVEFLLTNGARLDYRNPVTNRTPLSYCVYKGSNRDIARLLLAKGADPTVKAKFPELGYGARSVVRISEAARKKAPDIAALMESYATSARNAPPAGAASTLPVAGGLMASPAEGGKSVIAVANLGAEAVSASDAAVVADWIRGGLVATGVFTVVEKNNMDKVLAEQAFQQTGCTSEECAVKLGKILNVNHIVVGSLGKFMGANVLNIRVVEVETGRVIYADKAKGNTADEMESAVSALCNRMAGK